MIRSASVWTLGLVVCALIADCAAVERPFVLWNAADIALIKHRIGNDLWAAAEYERALNKPHSHEDQFARLLKYVVSGDESIAAAEKKELLSTARSAVPRGAAQYINVIRYDLLYDRLTEDERAEVEAFFHEYIERIVFERAIFDPNVFNDSANYSRYDARVYSRSNWLPNIAWPWKVSANLMAAALGDEQLVRRTWSAYGSWKWYFDEYLCDIGFYAEEFGKMGSTPGAMLIYCRAVEGLGLGELGFGYRGKGGATMRGHIESLIHLGYPALELHSSRAQFPMITMGDLRQSGSSQSWNLPSPAFQHSIVMGYTPAGFGGNDVWKAHGAWGGVRRGQMAQWDGYTGFTPKMQIPLWFEIAQRRWPEIGFDYFLVQMRAPDQDKYCPSLYFGLDPADPDEAEPPPAPSAVWPDRGIVMLRADESPTYWRSSAPAVSMRLATNYAHNVRDCFALTGFYAFNRPVYLNRQVTPGYAADWSRSIESHCSLIIDDAEPEFAGRSTVRKAFTDPVKFVAARNSYIYEGVDLTRCLMLTGRYLLDITDAASPGDHRYCWLVHALGEAVYDDGELWKPSQLPERLVEFEEPRVRERAEGPWSVVALQNCALADPEQAELPGQWYDRRIGVRVTMLAEPAADAFTAQTPLPIVRYKSDTGERAYRTVASEVGGVTIGAIARGKRARFAALHEPFEGGNWTIGEFSLVAAGDRAIAVSVKGQATDDRLMAAFGGKFDEPMTVSNGSEIFTFADWAFVRILPDTVEVRGSLDAMTLHLEGRRRLIVNGRAVEASYSDGMLTYIRSDR